MISACEQCDKCVFFLTFFLQPNWWSLVQLSSESYRRPRHKLFDLPALQSWIMSGIHKEKMNGQNTLILPEYPALVAMSLVPDWRKRGWEGSGSEQSAFNPYFPLFCGKPYFPLGMFSCIALRRYNLFIHCSWHKGKEPKKFRPYWGWKDNLQNI